MSYHIVKLSNGEDIICSVHEPSSSQETSKVKISSPLKMDTIARTTSKGIVESLSLARWVQPYSDEKYFNIERSSIVVMTPASIGIIRYYEYVLQNINEVVKSKSPTIKQLKQIDEEPQETLTEEDFEDILEEFKLKTKTTYH